jgi:cytochrome b6-f complex iron-sulfur subunit
LNELSPKHDRFDRLLTAFPTGGGEETLMEKVARDPDRRRFLNLFLGSSVGALLASALYPVLRFVNPPSVPEATTSRVEAGPVNDPEFLEHGFKIVRFGAEPVLVVRVSPTDYRAFSATCTHLDCIVEFQSDKKRIWCNCHNGEYDLTGRNVSGPPPKPLTPYKVDMVPGNPGQPSTVIVSRA